MHHEYAEPVLHRVRAGGWCWSTRACGPVRPTAARFTVVEVPATDRAVEVGNVLTAAMVMLGALAAVTGLVSLDALVLAVTRCVPPYRRQHVEANRLALAAGARTVPTAAVAAWPLPSPAARRFDDEVDRSDRRRPRS